MEIREMFRSASDIHKTSNFILLLPIYNDVAAGEGEISHANP